MDPLAVGLVPSVRPTLALAPTAELLLFAVCGVCLGTVSGLVPGVHANNFALLLAAVGPTLPGSQTAVGAAILAAGVVHTFLDVVPALALGVPDPAMAATALPGHRLVVAGRGREALRLSALGSVLAVALAVPLALPVTWLMTEAYPVVRAYLPVVLSAVVLLLFVTEPSRRAALAGAFCFVLASALGVSTLDLEPEAPLALGGMLAPLFSGLFGAPVLLDAFDGAGVPPQDDAALALSGREVGWTAGAGSLAGAFVGYLPGVSAAVASVLSLPLVPDVDDEGAREFLVASSGANTSNTVFALFALVTLGTPRTGVMVALEDGGGGVGAGALPALLATTALAALAGFVLVVVVGDSYLRVVGRTNYAVVSATILVLLVALSWLFAGLVGVGVFVVASLVGLVPVRLRTRRVHLMGVLVGPLVLGV
ncbi:tripartite tricarboxylate transporter permease [Haloprofundus halophilus]|uniref:tripartite tricarboxylate transporter permease n=1 Tax=Haloprofundus halophilus TaxID=2283527 RepID=UPI000E4368FE|nr:tripartite tricarboxylate transporter permease [Haloprofundus halophilus]